MGPSYREPTVLIIRSVVEKIWLKKTDDCLEVQFGLGWIEKEKKNSLLVPGWWDVMYMFYVAQGRYISAFVGYAGMQG